MSSLNTDLDGIRCYCLLNKENESPVYRTVYLRVIGKKYIRNKAELRRLFKILAEEGYHDLTGESLNVDRFMLYHMRPLPAFVLLHEDKSVYWG